MGFDAPAVLLLLPAVSLLVVLYWARWRHVRRVRAQFAGAARVGNPSGRWQLALKVSLLVAGSSALIVAAAEPRIARERRQEIYRKVDVVFLLDSSLSMRARDIAPSRFDRAAQEIETFIRKNREDIGRIGLVTFSGSTIVLSYLTSDPSNILFFLDHLRADAEPSFGTDIGGAVAGGLSVLEKERTLDAALDARSLIFVLISDGEDHGETVQAALARASQAGVRIYSVGIGSEMGDYIPIGEEAGRTRFLVDEAGRQILATFDEATLRWVADATGAAYFRSRSGDDLQMNLGAILERARVVADVRVGVQRIPLHRWFLAAAFAALTLGLAFRS
jgi:Ca-activated chloride channel family protein